MSVPLIIKCQVSLSKKLRAIIGDSETSINLFMSSTKDGRGEGILTLIVDSVPEESELLQKETSIMMTPTELLVDTVSKQEVGNLFASKANASLENKIAGKMVQTNRSAIDKMAVTEAPRRGSQGFAVQTAEEVVTPKGLELTDYVKAKTHVSNLVELLAEVNKAKKKVSNINLEEYSDKRQMAIALEQKELEEAIEIDAYIVNQQCASLALNDLGIQLQLNIPFNLARISAKRIANSRDLQTFLQNGMIKIISPEEAGNITKNFVKAQNFGLKTFSHKEDAEANIGMLDQRDDGILLDTRFGGSNLDRTSRESSESRESNMFISENDVGQESELEQMAHAVEQPRPNAPSRMAPRTANGGATTLSGGMRKTTFKKVIDNTGTFNGTQTFGGTEAFNPATGSSNADDYGTSTPYVPSDMFSDGTDGLPVHPSQAALPKRGSPTTQIVNSKGVKSIAKRF